jgi:drug/metabolite transporter (DMT)-like permease
VSTNDPPQQSGHSMRPSRLALSSRYVLLILIWSSTPLAVVLSVRELHPIWALCIRFVLAAPLGLLLLRLLKIPLRLDRVALRSYGAGSLGLLGAMLFCYLGAVHLNSGLVSMLFGLSPLFSGLLAWLGPQRQALQPVQWIGMALGVLGMSIAVGLWQSQHQAVSLVGVALIVAAMVLYVLSMFWVQAEQAQLHPLAQTTGSLLVSAFGMVLLLPFFMHQMPTQWPSVTAMLALTFSVVMASIVAIVCYFDLVTHLGPTPVALTTIMTPVLAVTWGAMFNHEAVGTHTVLGLAWVVLGMLLYFFADVWRQVRLKTLA